jgi:iron complex transport system ATP-binding protein
MMSTPILTARALDVQIAGIRICTALDLTVEPRQCWAILGRNGAGKTTLLATLAGLRAANAGTIEIDGRALSSFTPRELARVRALLPQDDSDPFPATALETALVGRHPHLGRWQWEGAEDLRIAREALAVVDMADAETRDVRTLSGGERRRTTLAAVLAQEPRLFLLDEPSSHLDLAHQVALLDRLGGLARSEGRALIMALHDVNLAARCCDHVLLLDRGAASAGPAEELLTSERLSALYGVPLRSVRDGERSVFVT